MRKSTPFHSRVSISRTSFSVLPGAFLLWLLLGSSFIISIPISAQVTESPDKNVSGKEHPDLQWFRDAKFGLFIHWGLYSKLAGTWKGRNYYGSGEWIMNRAKIPAAEYATIAGGFNPVSFDADEWTKLAAEAGIKYMVITAKHHEGFSMFDSKISDFNIVKASPYGRDPMKALAGAARKRGIRFGFYYSQYLDWHEANGGGNDWDFEESKKDYLAYYRQKSIPQLKELLTNYGPLGLIWFDMPGGLTKEQTQTMIDTLRRLQPNALFSSRVGQGLGDYNDFGDSEIPSLPLADPWEAIFTHNDSWGFIAHDMNFKSSAEIIRLLTRTASKGGNLMLNVGPDGSGRIPVYSQKYLRETGRWLSRFGQSIYGTTYGEIPPQPWGVSTSKPGKQYLHVFERPANGHLLLPDFSGTVTRTYLLDSHEELHWKKKGTDVDIYLPTLTDKRNTVIVVEYRGSLQKLTLDFPITVSSQYNGNELEAAYAAVYGKAHTESLTYSHYFGDWKHTTCVTGMKERADSACFHVRITDTGDFKILLQYSCSRENSRQEGSLSLDGKEYAFETLRTSEFDEGNPLLFIRHPVAIATITRPGTYTVRLSPRQDGKELFNLQSIILEPVR